MSKKLNKKNIKTQKEINHENLLQGMSRINTHPLFGACYNYFRRIGDKSMLGTKTLCIVDSDGQIIANEDIFLSPKQWSYVIAHNILHLAFGTWPAISM